jgi:hypothetical protein
VEQFAPVEQFALAEQSALVEQFVPAEQARVLLAQVSAAWVVTGRVVSVV